MIMYRPLEVPSAEELEQLPLEYSPETEPGVTTVVVHAADQETVTVTWDEVARSVAVRWHSGGEVRLALERESVSRVIVHDTAEGVEFRLTSEMSDMRGVLHIQVGSRVRVTDTLLQT